MSLLLMIAISATLATHVDSNDGGILRGARRMFKSMKCKIKQTFHTSASSDRLSLQNLTYRDSLLSPDFNKFDTNKSILFPVQFKDNKKKSSFNSDKSNSSDKNNPIDTEIETVSNLLTTRNYSLLITQGIWEGLMAEVISAFMNEQSYEYTTIDAFHLTVKSLILDVLTNALTLFMPKISRNLVQSKKFSLMDEDVNAADAYDGDEKIVMDDGIKKDDNSKVESHQQLSSTQLKAKRQRDTVQLTVAIIRCIIIPLLFHGVAHTLPSAAMHMLFENLREASQWLDHALSSSELILDLSSVMTSAGIDASTTAIDMDVMQCNVLPNSIHTNMIQTF